MTNPKSGCWTFRIFLGARSDPKFHLFNSGANVFEMTVEWVEQKYYWRNYAVWYSMHEVWFWELEKDSWSEDLLKFSGYWYFYFYFKFLMDENTDRMRNLTSLIFTRSFHSNYMRFFPYLVSKQAIHLLRIRHHEHASTPSNFGTVCHKKYICLFLFRAYSMKNWNCICIPL